MTSIPFYLVTGFLGSGKTTLLKKFLDRYADQKRIAVIQNEFAAGSVDGAELKQTGKKFEILEINRGSVFCVCLLSDFKASLTDLIDDCKPDLVILEATGLADPIAIGQLLQAQELRDRLYLAHVWCIADTTSFLQIEATVTRVAHQVRVADTVVLNKTDLSEPEAIKNVAARISNLNPHAELVSTSFCDLQLPTDLGVYGRGTVAEGDLNQLLETCSEGRPDLSSAVVRTTHCISQENLMRFIAEFEDQTCRLKGFVNLPNKSTVSVQSCFGKTEVKSVAQFSGPSELIAMGVGLNPDHFKSRFDQYVE